MKKHWYNLRQFLQHWIIRCSARGSEALSGNPETTRFFRVRRNHAQAIWYFEVLSGSSRGRHFTADAPIIRIGRVPENHIQLDDPKISRFHAEIHRRGGSLYIRDLHSTNGTRLNGKELSREVRLKTDDCIGLGDSELKLLQLKSNNKQAGLGVD